MQVISKTLLILAVVAITGCATSNPQTIESMKSDQYGAIAGNMTAPGGINALIIQELAVMGQRSTAKMDEKGNFIFENLKPGEYYLSSFVRGAGGYERFQLTQGDMESINQTKVSVAAGKIVYIGSYIVGKVESKLVGPGSFTYTRVKQPTEKTILQALLPKVAGKGWDRLILARIKSMH